MRALVAMSGGVDSSVAAALMLRAGHEVVGATMKLWGGPSDSGCCSVADVEDARRVCQQLGISHHVFNFTSEFERDVVAPYVQGHAQARTPNPCIACNAHLKFDRFLERARLLGFDVIVTGHHARVTRSADAWQLRRGRDAAKDQSYVLYMLAQDQLADLRLPIGELTKAAVRELAGQIGLRTAAKPDSKDVCFISKVGGRESFLGQRIPVSPGRLVATTGEDLGPVGALELVTVGQRRGLGLSARALSERRYVVNVDIAERRATVGPLDDLLVRRVGLTDLRWAHSPVPDGVAVEVQLSAHGRPLAARWEAGGRPPAPPLSAASQSGAEAIEPGAGAIASVAGAIRLHEPARRVAPGQAVVLYQPDSGGDVVLGGGTAV
jgi:tRNA-specific 2-thiouridylase